ncbi:hypothetical protein [Arthrobacter bambusae]|uniref:Uncharacterized protein n=1 Tax=Arthrobacter bambusae TaxID=1338426 RepID=A0AAW8DIS9_9MICC|nr:hypothetical protein [Arthrobacter bambusae]MDP9904743.1 hypothetical protein [Arthrobacter bambusae]MDQ0129559.1 hypothetical protein [Arthrobacter bambusae]MDQ0180828.1 hypothetical protein [Arthrobacter bambusae]
MHTTRKPSSAKTTPDRTTAEILDGNPVRGQSCPRCHRDSIVYNGNYWCTECPWAMSEQGRPKRIVAAYLAQERDRCLAEGDDNGVRRMETYLKEYDGVVF